MKGICINIILYPALKSNIMFVVVSRTETKLIFAEWPAVKFSSKLRFFCFFYLLLGYLVKIYTFFSGTYVLIFSRSKRRLIRVYGRFLAIASHYRHQSCCVEVVVPHKYIQLALLFSSTWTRQYLWRWLYVSSESRHFCFT